MDDPKTLDLVKELLQRLISTSRHHTSSAAPPLPPSDLAKSLKYAHRVLSSRMSPSISIDEAAMAESIKRSLARQHRPSDALAFADLYSKLVSLTSSLSSSVSVPPRNRWSFLYLVKCLSNSSSQTPRIFSAGALLPSLPILESSSYSGRNSGGVKKGLGAGGVFTVSKDPENMREIALIEHSDLVSTETTVSESVLVRDVLYVAQGIDGSYVKYDVKINGYDLPPDSGSFKVPRATRTMVTWSRGYAS